MRADAPTRISNAIPQSTTLTPVCAFIATAPRIALMTAGTLNAQPVRETIR
jgi:hypothetical protein